MIIQRNSLNAFLKQKCFLLQDKPIYQVNHVCSVYLESYHLPVFTDSECNTGVYCFLAALPKVKPLSGCMD